MTIVALRTDAVGLTPPATTDTTGTATGGQIVLSRLSTATATTGAARPISGSVKLDAAFESVQFLARAQATLEASRELSTPSNREDGEH